MIKRSLIFIAIAQALGTSEAIAEQSQLTESSKLHSELLAECTSKSVADQKSPEQIQTCINDKKREREIEHITVQGRYIGLQIPEVSGRYTLDREFLENTPYTAGDISEQLGLLPGVILGNDAYDANQQAEIGAKRVSISGGQPWQTGFFLDGVNFNSRQDPSAYDRSKSTPNDVQGAVQAFNVNQQIVESIDVFTNNIPANYSGFSGGVVEVKTREATETRFALNYRTSQSDWNEYHVILNEEDDTQRELPLTPIFEKNVYNLDFSTAVSKHHSILVAANYTESKISEISLNEAILTSRENANVLVKFTQSDLWLDEISLSLNYAPYESHDIIKNVLHSDFENEGGGYSSMLKLEQEIANIRFSSKLSYTQSDNSRQASPHFYPWYKAKGKAWGVGDDAEKTSLSREGGYGKLNKTQETLFWEIDAEFDEFTLLDTQHYLQAGLQVSQETIHRERFDDSYKYNSPITGVNQLNCAIALFDCVELETSMTQQELEAQLGTPLDLTNPEHVLAYSNTVVTAPQYFALRTVYQQERIDVDVQNLSAYVSDEIEWHDFTIRAGLRYDHDNFLKNHNIAPRLSVGYRINGDQDTVLLLGLNRYFDSNLLTYKIREQQLPTVTQRRAINSEGAIQTWQDLSSSSDYRYKFNNVNTPFSDELVLGWKQATDFGNYSIEYVKRWSQEQLTPRNEPEYNPEDGYYYRQLTNLGSGHNERISISWAWYLNSHSFWANSTYQLSQYTNNEQFEDVESAAISQLAYLRTSFSNDTYQYEETTKDNIALRSEEFGEPLSINLGWTANWTETLTTSFNASYRQSYTAIQVTDISFESAQIDRVCSDCQAGESLLIDVYEEVELPSRVLANFSIKWRYALVPDKDFQIGLDVKNIFDSRTHSVSGTASGVETGRSIWLSFGVEL